VPRAPVVSSTPRHKPLARYEHATLLVIGTDCIGSCIPNYHTITVTAAFIVKLTQL
jgi:succinyl-CoA synthetase alpha subunit